MNSIAISTEKLTKNYGDLIAVKDLTLEIYRGEIFGFLGPNGAGKSTSIGMMCGIIHPGSGKVMIHNQKGSAGNDVNRLIGLCPQEIILWPKLTCMEQLVFTGQMYGMSRSRARNRSMDLLVRMGLQEKKGKLAATLSGGMKRRLNLCLALVHDPEIVVLDEPEAGLDPQSRLMVREFIRELGKSKTVILTTHNMDEADRLADRIAIMDHGQILIQDTPVNLKRSTGDAGIIQVMITPMPGKGLAEMDLYLKAHKRKTMLQADRMLIRETADPEILWHIYKMLKDNGFNIAEISLRQPTLEDVFIGLTGRNLRDN